MNARGVSFQVCIVPFFFFCKLVLPSLLSLLLAFGNTSSQAQEEQASPVIIAIQKEDVGTLETNFLADSERYLKYALPDHPIVFLHLSFSEIQKLSEARKIDFALTSPDNYVVLERFFGARAMVSHHLAEAPSPDTTKGIVLIVRSGNHELQSIHDLDKKRVLVSETIGTDSRIFSREMIHAGISHVKISAVSDTANITPDNKEKAIVREIADGHYDAGVLPACFFEHERKNKPSLFKDIRFLTTDRVTETRCLSSSVFYPGWTFASFPSTDPVLSNIVAGTLLGIPFETDSSNWQRGARYGSLHELLEITEDQNYQRQTQWSWRSFLHKYGVWIAALMLCIVGLIIHSIRASFLVRRRTEELLATVAEKHRIAEEAERYNKKLIAFERVGLVGELSSMIAHEVKQPLAVIRNYTRGLKRALAHGNADPELFQTVLEKIDRQSTKASEIIDHVRNVAKQKLPNAKPMCLSDLFEKAISQFEQTKKTPVIRRIVPALWVSADTLEMELLINNLLKNAADATSETQKPIIIASLTTEFDRVVLSIEDNGPKLTDEAFARLSTPLNTSKPGGLGLGLVIVRRIAEAACGNLAFVRKPKCGLIISVTLPRYPNNNRPLNKENINA